MPKLSNPSETALWHYALSVYARPGIQALCLRLQTAGADVCLLLAAAWLNQRGVACSSARVEQLEAIAGPWRRDVIEPLRKLRQNWRAEAACSPELDLLREQVKTLELQAERSLLERLELKTADWPSSGTEDLGAWLKGVAADAVHLDRPALEELHRAILEAS